MRLYPFLQWRKPWWFLGKLHRSLSVLYTKTTTTTTVTHVQHKIIHKRSSNLKKGKNYSYLPKLLSNKLSTCEQYLVSVSTIGFGLTITNTQQNLSLRIPGLLKFWIFKFEIAYPHFLKQINIGKEVGQTWVESLAVAYNCSWHLHAHPPFGPPSVTHIQCYFLPCPSTT